MDRELRGVIRSYVTKMPNLYFSAFPQIFYMSSFLTSNDDFKLVLENNIWVPNEYGEDVAY